MSSSRKNVVKDLYVSKHLDEYCSWIICPQGESPGLPLSEMGVNDICRVLKRLTGINAENLKRYVTTLKQQNISGYVLTHCDLQVPVLLLEC